jgi:anti-sigma factor RsiW
MMNCERVVELLTGPVGESAAQDRREAAKHATECEDCRGAVASVHALRLVSLAPMPPARPDAWERALSAATRRSASERPRANRFWLGMGLGAAIATAAAIAVVALLPFTPVADPIATPTLTLALNQPQSVNISLNTPEALLDAEIHVLLSGAVGLGGYPGQRELQWRTNLDAGINQLSLPVVATGAEGGQVLVEVIHAGKRRTFLVDVQARA